MSRSDILTDIKNAEAAAAEMIREAEADRTASVADARRASVSRIKDAESRMRNDSEMEISKKKRELSAEREKVLNVGTAEAESLERSAADRMSKVRDFLNKEFERTLNAVS